MARSSFANSLPAIHTTLLLSMGDYFPFATADGGLLSSGFNGFPFALDDWTNTPVYPYTRPETISEDTSFVGVDMMKAIKWIWRVRKWKLSFSVSVAGFANFDYSSGTPVPIDPFTAGPLTAEIILSTRYINFPQIITREREIPLIQWGRAWVVGSYTTNGPVDASIPDLELQFLNPPFARPIYQYSSSKFAKINRINQVVYVPFSSGAIAITVPNKGSATIQFGEANPGSGTPRQQFTAYIDGVPAIWEHSGENPSNNFRVTSISVSIDPIEYWPYAAPDKVLYSYENYNVGDPHPNAGLPIYDTATGATLLDPVTGF
jgi:hypothetical protein